MDEHSHEDFETGEMAVPTLLQLTAWLGLAGAATLMLLTYVTSGDALRSETLPLIAVFVAISLAALIGLVAGYAALERHPDEDHPVFH